MRRTLIALTLSLLTVSVMAQKSFRGVYLGSVFVAGQSTSSVVLLNVLKNDLAVGLVYDFPGRSFVEVPELKIAPDGKFTLTALGVLYSGQIQGEAFSAIGTPGNVIVTGTRSPLEGPAKTYAGTYPGWLVTASGTFLHGAVITPDGRILTYAQLSPTTADGAVGTIDGAGKFTLSFVGGGSATGEVQLNPAAPVVAGSYLRSGAMANFIGGRESANNDLINISTRGFVGKGASVMVAGFIIQPGAKTVYIRALGPSLAMFGVDGALADPVIQLYSGQTVIATNDDWANGPDGPRIALRGDKPFDSKDAGLIATLEPGPYTVILSGKGDSTGNALIEVNQVE